MATYNGAPFIKEQLESFAAETGLSMGQWLSIPLILAGLALMAWALWRPELGAARKPATA